MNFKQLSELIDKKKEARRALARKKRHHVIPEKKETVQAAPVAPVVEETAPAPETEAPELENKTNDSSIENIPASTESAATENETVTEAPKKKKKYRRRFAEANTENVDE